MIVLGISVGHDRGAVIIKDGKVLIGITQERISRVKNDGAYGNGKIPLESILYCMSEHNLTMSDIDLIVYSTTEILDTTYDQLNKLFHIPEKK